MSYSRIITFLSGKGGTGKTVLAVNLATILSLKGSGRVLFIDTNQSSHDVAALFNMADIRGVNEAFKDNANAVRTTFNVHVVSCSLKKESVNIVDIFIRARESFDYIIVDTEKNIEPGMAPLLDSTDMAILVTTPDMLSLNQSGYTISNLASMHFPREKTHVILNRAKDIMPVSRTEIEKYLEKKVMITIPEDEEAVRTSVFNETPFVFKDSSSILSKALDRVAMHVISGRDNSGELVYDNNNRNDNPILKESGVMEDKHAVLSDEIKIKIHRQLVKEIDINNGLSKELHERAEKKAGEILDEYGIEADSRKIRMSQVKEIMDEVFGMGPLETLLRDERITEIMVNAPDKIYIETDGHLSESGKSFIDKNHVIRVIERVVSPLGKRIDESSPYVDARLPDGSRVNAVINPVSINGPILTIRKFRSKAITINELINSGTLDNRISDFLNLCVKARKNMVISGGTGTGKTTLLNIISGFIPRRERIITIEDSAEINLNQEHVVKLEARPPNIEGAGEVTIRNLVRNALRMRPDRIVVGECRGSEAIDMLQAMNTGHDGSITTVHANSTRDVLSRIETMVLMSGLDIPIKAVREQIASAIQIVVHMTRFLKDGSRKITQVSEVTGIENGVITMQDIYKYRQDGLTQDDHINGKFESTGFVPGFLEDIKSSGLNVNMEMFL